MTYQVLARKWRPQDFSELIGQEPIVTALRNALAEGRIAQAYLFSGIRGVGKTTAARLLAKALNCEKGPRPEPCNECLMCREITRGADLDVIEVDAATYSKVEQVRELTESLKYGPARDRYKVVVLDEIHRLSRQAFDALLKIVEEPPEHLVFIFATTELEAVPATVLSRCQEFHFRRVPADKVAPYLARMAEAEDIEASDTALHLLARAGEGSVRDAVALLDQLATFGGGTISDDEAVRLLGGLDLELFRELLEGILDARPTAVRKAVARVEEEGWDPRNVYGQFLAYCRDALHLAMGADPEATELPRDEAEALSRLARKAGYENLLRLSQQLLSSEQAVRRSEAGALAAEIAWLRAAELPKLTRIEDLLGGGPPVAESRGEGPGQSDDGGAGGAAPQQRVPQEPPPSEPPRREPPPAPASPPRQAEQTGLDDEPGPGGEPLSIPSFLSLAEQRRPPLAARLEHGKLSFDDGVLTVTLPAQDRVWLERSTNRSALERLVQEAWGEDASYRLREAPPSPEEEGAAAGGDGGGRKREGSDQVEEDETVQTVLDLFGGTVVEERDTTDEDSSDNEGRSKA